MKIIHFTGMHSCKYGSLEEHYVALSKECARRGHTLKIVYMSAPECAQYVKDIESNNAEIIVAGGGLFRLASRALGILLAERPDVLHVHFMPTAYVLLGLGLFSPAVIYWTKHSMMGAGRYDRAVLLHKALYRRAKRIFCVSGGVKKELEGLGIEGNLERADIGINRERFSGALESPGAVRGELGIPPEGLVVSSISWAVPVKGVEVFIKAAPIVLEKYPDIQFLHVGGGPLEQELKGLSSKLGAGGSVHFLGKRNDVEKIHKITDIFVLPSYSEGLGLVLLEAMACGTPVIGTDVGGVPDIITDGVTGLLVPPGDPRALADAIIKCIESPGLRSSLGAEGRKLVEARFDVRESARELIDVYESDLAGLKAAPAAKLKAQKGV